MALTPDEEEQIRKLLARENDQNQKAILASKDSLKRWLKKVAVRLVETAIDTAIDALFDYLKAKFLGF
mgnify:CR=1 FL=1